MLSDDTLGLLKVAVESVADKKGFQINLIDVSALTSYTDVFVLCSAANERQVRGVVDGVEEAAHRLGAKPLRREGESEGHWVLLDFGDVVVHVQLAEERIHYAIERLWKDCPAIALPESVHLGRAGGGATA